MRARFISEMTEGSVVDAVYALRSKEMRAARNGEAYLALELADRTGSIPAVNFRPSSGACEIPVGAVVRARGTVTSFRGVRRVSVESLRPAETWQPADLLASSPRPLDEMIGELRSIMGSIADAELRSLLRAVFGEKEFFERFRTCPGSQSYHHAHLSGLIEHTVAVAGLCDTLSPRYAGIDRDLLVAAALLHDIGKVDELSFESDIRYTDRGRLLGHVVLGVQRVAAAASRARVSSRTAMRLEHAILSHHGELEWGSPKRPSTIEALLLHHVDNLDAKAAGFVSLVRGASLADESWTDAGNLFRRPLYAPRAVEDDRVIREGEDDQHFRMTA